MSMRRGKTNIGGEEDRTPGMGYEHLGPQLWGGASSIGWDGLFLLGKLIGNTLQSGRFVTPPLCPDLVIPLPNAAKSGAMSLSNMES